MTVVRDFINSCDKLTNLSPIDKEDLLQSLLKYSLVYRDSLGLNPDLTFGTEIEYDGVFYTRMSAFAFRTEESWINKAEGSVKLGGEVTSPILTDTKESWKDLKRICGLLKEYGAYSSHLTGSHIHIGSNIFKEDVKHVFYFLALYSAFENILIRYSAGEENIIRPRYEVYAIKIREKMQEFFKKYNLDSLDSYDLDIMDLSYYIGIPNAINVTNIRINDPFQFGNTIEIRTPNGTLEEVIWQNNINTFAKMIEYSISDDFDEDLIDTKLVGDLTNHNNLNIDLAFEFADLVFKSNLDKAYFLRQYIKDLTNPEENDYLYDLPKVKRFIK